MTTEPVLLRRDEYLDRLAACLVALGADVKRQDGCSLKIEGTHVYVDAPYKFVTGVDVRDGSRWRARGKHRFRKVGDVDHIAKQILRIVAEAARATAARKAYAIQVNEQAIRERDAGEKVKKAIAAINAATSGLGPVNGFEVGELHSENEGQRSYVFELSLRGLTEAQALAILGIVGDPARANEEAAGSHRDSHGNRTVGDMA
jgi:hypothetical protein